MLNKPAAIKLHRKSGKLELCFEGTESLSLSFEFLRVHSPSAEVRGHGPGEEKLQAGKREVKIQNIEPIGNYAIKISFDDGHDSGIYSWDYLQYLAENEIELWQAYLQQLKEAGASRDPNVSVVKIIEG